MHFKWLITLNSDELYSYFFLAKFPIFLAGTLIALVLFKANMIISAHKASQEADIKNEKATSTTTSSRVYSYLRLTAKIIADPNFKFCLGIFTVIYCSYGFRLFAPLVNASMMSTDVININVAVIYYIFMQIIYMAGMFIVLLIFLLKQDTTMVVHLPNVPNYRTPSDRF
jgi:hypothetical protein